MKEQEINQEQLKKVKKILKQNPQFLLVSVSMLVDGYRKFIDIPLITLLFPTKSTIFMYAMEQINIEDKEKQLEIIESFAIVNVHEFKSQQDYESYIGESLIPESENQVKGE